MGQQLWGCFKTPLWRAEDGTRCDTGGCTPAEQQNSPSSAASQTSLVTPPRAAGTSQGNLHWYCSSRRKKLLWIAKGHRAAVYHLLILQDFHLSFSFHSGMGRKENYLPICPSLLCAYALLWHYHSLEMQDFVILCREVRWKALFAHSKYTLRGHPTSSEGLCGSSIFPSHLKATCQPSTSRRRFSSQNLMFLRHMLH